MVGSHTPSMPYFFAEALHALHTPEHWVEQQTPSTHQPD
jgi:hypothetical protein